MSIPNKGSPFTSLYPCVPLPPFAAELYDEIVEQIDGTRPLPCGSYNVTDMGAFYACELFKHCVQRADSEQDRGVTLTLFTTAEGSLYLQINRV
jgi:hypothetical protein